MPANCAERLGQGRGFGRHRRFVVFQRRAEPIEGVDQNGALALRPFREQKKIGNLPLHQMWLALLQVTQCRRQQQTPPNPAHGGVQSVELFGFLEVVQRLL